MNTSNLSNEGKGRPKSTTTKDADTYQESSLRSSIGSLTDVEHFCDCSTQKDEIKNLKAQLSRALQALSVQNSVYQQTVAEVAQLQRTTQELETESDDLVNDIHTLQTENEELKSLLQASNRREASISSRLNHVTRERDRFSEMLEIQGENKIGSDEVAQVMESTRVHMRRRMKQEAIERLDLEEKVKDLTWQRDELNQTVETLATENSSLEQKNSEMKELVEMLQCSVEKQHHAGAAHDAKMRFDDDAESAWIKTSTMLPSLQWLHPSKPPASTSSIPRRFSLPLHTTSPNELQSKQGQRVPSAFTLPFSSAKSTFQTFVLGAFDSARCSDKGVGSKEESSSDSNDSSAPHDARARTA